MVTITDSNLRSSVYETVYDLVTGISAWGLSSSATVTVTAAYIEGKSDTPLPQVVVHSPEISSDASNFDRTLMDREVRVLIEVFTGGEKKRKDLDQISDKIVSTLETASTPGMQLVDMDENNAMPTVQSKIASKALSFTYRRRS
jgi:hypothetical protein